MIQQVLELLEAHKYSQLKELLSDMNPVDLAEVFEELEEEHQSEKLLKLFRLLKKENAAEAFSYMEPEVQQAIVESVTDSELRYILDDLYIDDYVDMIEEMPANVVKRVLKNSSEENRKLVNQFLQYPEDSAGSIMTIEFVNLRRSNTIKQAFELIRKTGVDKETIYTCYVISRQRVLEGVVTAKHLLLADPDALVEDVMEENPLFATTTDDREEAAKLMTKYELLALPVVDKEQRLVGIITIDDAVDVLEEETTEDFEKMAGMAPSEESYLRTPVWKLAKNRIVWLMVLMISGIITGLLLASYESAFSAIPALVAFIPMLMDTGGNCGSQAATMIIRGMALDEINLKDVLTVWFKEVRVSLICGAALAIFNIVRVYLQYQNIVLGIVVGLTLMVVVCMAKSLGCLLPMLAKKLKLDPALMAAPMLTTIVDAFAVVMYFTIAIALMNIAV